ncbi:MAG: hypothetical protein ACR2OR_07660, partial [Hyphomicrobiales bacterium]
APVAGNIEISTSIDEAISDFDESSRKALLDHAGLNVRPVAFRAQGKTGLVVFSVKRKQGDIEFHEALYISERETFAANARPIADAILPPKQALMSVDMRLIQDFKPQPDEARPLPVQRGFQSAGLKPSEMDFLYSEIPHLDLKLY